MSSSSTPGASRTSSRRIKPNPNFSPLPGIAKTMNGRERAASLSSSPSRKSDGNGEWERRLEDRVSRLEAMVTVLESENRSLRERLEEEEEARRQIEDKLRAVVEDDEKERGEIKTELKKIKEVEKEWKKEKEEDRKLMKEIKEVVDKLAMKTGEEEEKGGEDDDSGSPYKCVVLTDSNGKEVTEETIKNHIPAEKRAKYQIKIEVAYRLEDAYSRIDKGEIDVGGAYVIVDNVTNNVRGGKNHDPEPPDLVTDRVAALRELILEKAAKAVVVCELKPMKWVDVRAHSAMIHRYLISCGKSGYGCRTQIRMRYLKEDGFHVQPKHLAILDKTYACALLGIYVPDPTPLGDLVPEYTRRRWENEWPRMGGRGPPKS